MKPRPRGRRKEGVWKASEHGALKECKRGAEPDQWFCAGKQRDTGAVPGWIVKTGESYLVDLLDRQCLIQNPVAICGC